MGLVALLHVAIVAAWTVLAGGADNQTTDAQPRSSVVMRNRSNAVVRVLGWVICVGIAAAVLADSSVGGTQFSVARFPETVFGPNGLADAEFTPPLDD
ncbi:MAG TPA: hypothetical protein VLE94_14915 [Burkholderiaceae bacterium]|nr:hypothetical protein [Burkholderiaceae bacterium]